MRILTVSDKVEPVLYGPYIRERVGQPDLILACGDLPYDYLEYIVALLDVPLYFVHGNHDKFMSPDDELRYIGSGAGSSLTWAVNLHLNRVNHDGLLLAGLEGCRRYNPDGAFQYSEAEMRCQVRGLSLRLLSNRIRYGRYVDIFVTHAPPRGIHDGEDLPHQGFASYLTFLRQCRPLLMIHGHQHVYDRNMVTETLFSDTRVINTYGYRLIELASARTGCGWDMVSSR